MENVNGYKYIHIYIIIGAMWGGIIGRWLVPMIRKRIACEIYEACGLGSFFTILILGHSGIATQLNILALRITGLVILATGATFVISAFVALKRKGKPESGWENTTALIDSGVFGTVRHPLYLGTAISATGLMLMYQSIPSTILGVISIFCCRMASKKEDEFNIQKFGDSYEKYTKKVPMWNVFKGLGKRGL